MKESMRLHSGRLPIKLNDGDLRRLHIFCTVTRCGGFAAAESALQMGLPSISRYIKDLEIRLGVRLCKRGRVGFELTEQGRRVFEASLQLATDLHSFESKMRGIHDGVTGTLAVGLIDTLITDGNLPLPQLLRQYRLRYPLVELNVQTKTTTAIEQSLLDGSLDVGLIVGRRRNTQLDYRLLYREQNRLYCCSEHPLYHRDDQTISIKDISEFDYAGYSFGNEMDQSGPARFLHRSATADSVEAMAALVSSGCFIGILPEHYVRSVWRLQNFKAVMPELFSMSTAIELVTRHAAHPPRVTGLLELLAPAQDGPEAALGASAPSAEHLDAPGSDGSPLEFDVGPGVTH